MQKDMWEVQIKGEKGSRSFEISVVRQSNKLGHESWGWFNDKKLLISHNGGPCRWPLTEKIWDKLTKLADDVCAELNMEEFGVVS